MAVPPVEYKKRRSRALEAERTPGRFAFARARAVAPASWSAVDLHRFRLQPTQTSFPKVPNQISAQVRRPQSGTEEYQRAPPTGET